MTDTCGDGDEKQVLGVGGRRSRGSSASRVGKGAAVVGNRDEVVGSVATQGGSAIEGSVLHTSAPAQTILGSRDRLHRTVPVDSSDAVELLGKYRTLEFSLLTQLDVLEVTTPTQLRHGAGGRDAVRAGVPNRDDLGEPVRCVGIVGDLDAHVLTWQSASHEHDATVHPCNAVPAVRNRAKMSITSHVWASSRCVPFEQWRDLFGVTTSHGRTPCQKRHPLRGHESGVAHAMGADAVPTPCSPPVEGAATRPVEQFTAPYPSRCCRNAARAEAADQQ